MSNIQGYRVNCNTIVPINLVKLSKWRTYMCHGSDRRKRLFTRGHIHVVPICKAGIAHIFVAVSVSIKR